MQTTEIFQSLFHVFGKNIYVLCKNLHLLIKNSFNILHLPQLRV